MQERRRHQSLAGPGETPVEGSGRTHGGLGRGRSAATTREESGGAGAGFRWGSRPARSRGAGVLGRHPPAGAGSAAAPGEAWESGGAGLLLIVFRVIRFWPHSAF